MNQKRMLVYVMALMGMMLILSLSNNPFPGDAIKETPESAIAMGLSTEEAKVEAEDIQILASADAGKSKLFIFEKEGELWAAYASGDIFSLRYDLAYQQLGEENTYLLQDYLHKYTYEYTDGELKLVKESFSINDDLVFTAAEILIIAVMLFGAGRKNRKKDK